MSEELDALVDQAYALPYGPTQTELLEQIVERAEAEERLEEAFWHRTSLVSCYVQTGENRLVFAPFARLLADYDADPGRYADGHERMLWLYKSIISSMTRFPQISLRQTELALADMERRWLESGHTLHAVHQYRWLLADHLGDGEAAEEHFRRWTTTPRDSLSDCVGCDPNSQIRHLRTAGRHVEAVALGHEVLARDDLDCVEQPQSVQRNLLPSLVALGHLDQAREFHQRSYRTIRTKHGELSSVTDHLRFCVATGNLDRARDLYVRHVRELDQDTDPFTAMQFAAVAGRFLREAAADPDVDTVPDERGDLQEPAVLATRFADQAQELAQRFDARNGTAHQSERINHLLTEARWVDSLPMIAPLDRAFPEPANPSGRDPVTADESDQGHESSPVEHADPAGLEVSQLLDLADEARWARRVDVERAALERFQLLRPAPRRSAQEHGRLLDAEARSLAESGKSEEAQEKLRTALVHFHEADDECRGHRARARLAYLLARENHLDEAESTGNQALAWLIENDEPRRRSGWRFQRALIDRAAGRFEQTYATLRDLYSTRLEDPELAEWVSAMLAEAELHNDSYAAAIEVVERALGSTDPGVWRMAHGIRAEARRRSGDHDGAIEDRLRLLAGSTEVPDAASDPYALISLAQEYDLAERPSDAVEAAEVAVRVALQQDVAECVEVGRRLLVNGYRDLDEPLLALEQAEALVAMTTESDPLPWQAAVAEDHGEMLALTGRHAVARPILEHAAALWTVAGEEAAAVRALRRALSCADDEGAVEDGERLWSQAIKACDLIPEDEAARWFHQGWLWLARAEAEHRRGRMQEVGTACDKAARAFTRGGLGDLADEAELRCAEWVGADLEELRRLFVAAPEHSRTWYRAGWLVVERLDDVDRKTEAQVLAAELEAPPPTGPSA